MQMPRSGLFESKHFGALFTGAIALGTVEGGIHDWRLLAIPVLVTARAFI